MIQKITEEKPTVTKKKLKFTFLFPNYLFHNFLFAAWKIREKFFFMSSIMKNWIRIWQQNEIDGAEEEERGGILGWKLD